MPTRWIPYTSYLESPADRLTTLISRYNDVQVRLHRLLTLKSAMIEAANDDLISNNKEAEFLLGSIIFEVFRLEKSMKKIDEDIQNTRAEVDSSPRNRNTE